MERLAQWPLEVSSLVRTQRPGPAPGADLAPGAGVDLRWGLQSRQAVLGPSFLIKPEQ